MTAITARYDRSAILRDAWGRARQAAAEAAQGVRTFLFTAMRAAWATAKAALRRASSYRLTHGEFVLSFVPVGADGECEVTVLAQQADGSEQAIGTAPLYPARFATADAVLQEALRSIGHEEAATEQPAPQEASLEPGPDLSTVKGLSAVLLGRTAVLPLVTWEATYVVTAVERWTSPDGSLVRDYVNFEVTGNRADKGPVNLFVERKGGGRGAHMDTKAGRAFWGYGTFCNSGRKTSNADDLVREILAPIAL